MQEISSKFILEMINKYCDKHQISLASFAKEVGISRSWLSRLNNEENKNISLQLAGKLLRKMGYELKITTAGLTVSHNRLYKKYE